MRHRFTFICSLLAFFGCTSQAQTELKVSGASLSAELDKYIQEKIDTAFGKTKSPGMFVAVSQNGNRRYYAAGFADPETKLVFDSSTLFEIGSITKTFTAYLLLSVLRDHKIDENSTIVTYLPDSVKFNPALRRITFLQLLNHTAGLPRLADNMDLASRQPYAEYDDSKLFEFLKTVQPSTSGNSEYSNLGFGLAGVLASRIANKPYPQLVHEYVLVPFGIRTIADSSGVSFRKSQGFLNGEKVDFWKFQSYAGAGSLILNTEELLSYLEYLMNPTANKELATKVLEPTAELRRGMRVARAWHTLEEQGYPVIYWHNGGTYGFSTFAAFDKKNKLAVVVAINSFNKNNIGDALGVAIIKKMILK